MPPRDSGTFQRSAHPHAEPGAMVLVEDRVLPARAVIRHLRGPVGDGVPVEWAKDLSGLQAIVHPVGHQSVGRRRIRGFLLDFHLGGRRNGDALSVLAWLRSIYPRTPAVVYTGSTAAELERAAAGRARFVRAENLDEERVTHGVLADAMLGVLHPPDGTQVLVLRKAAFGPPVLDACNERFFVPWDRRCVALRKWLLAEAQESAMDLKEYHLCTLDAYFDSLAVSELCVARGVSAATLEQNLKEIRALYQIKDIDILRARWERFRFGRGASRPAEPPWLLEQAPVGRDGGRPEKTTATQSHTRLAGQVPATENRGDVAASRRSHETASSGTSRRRTRRPSARRQPRADLETGRE